MPGDDKSPVVIELLAQINTLPLEAKERLLEQMRDIQRQKIRPDPPAKRQRK